MHAADFAEQPADDATSALSSSATLAVMLPSMPATAPGYGFHLRSFAPFYGESNDGSMSTTVGRTGEGLPGVVYGGGYGAYGDGYDGSIGFNPANGQQDDSGLFEWDLSLDSDKDGTSKPYHHGTEHYTMDHGKEEYAKEHDDGDKGPLHGGTAHTDNDEQWDSWTQPNNVEPVQYTGQYTGSTPPPKDPGCICTLQFEPVCGADGRQYGNRCQVSGSSLHANQLSCR